MRSTLVLLKVVQVPFGETETHPETIAQTQVLRMVVFRGIQPVANGRIENAFLKKKVSSIPYVCWLYQRFSILNSMSELDNQIIFLGSQESNTFSLHLPKPVQTHVQIYKRMPVMKQLLSLYSLQTNPLLQKLTQTLRALRPINGTMVKVHLFAQKQHVVMDRAWMPVLFQMLYRLVMPLTLILGYVHVFQLQHHQVNLE